MLIVKRRIGNLIETENQSSDGVTNPPPNDVQAVSTSAISNLNQLRNLAYCTTEESLCMNVIHESQKLHEHSQVIGELEAEILSEDRSAMTLEQKALLLSIFHKSKIGALDFIRLFRSAFQNSPSVINQIELDVKESERKEQMANVDSTRLDEVRKKILEAIKVRSGSP